MTKKTNDNNSVLVNLDQEFKDISGTTYMDSPDGRTYAPLRMRTVLVRALSAPDKTALGEEVVRRYKAAMEIVDREDPEYPLNKKFKSVVEEFSKMYAIPIRLQISNILDGRDPMDLGE
jgi:hypothetical protein